MGPLGEHNKVMGFQALHCQSILTFLPPCPSVPFSIPCQKCPVISPRFNKSHHYIQALRSHHNTLSSHGLIRTLKIKRWMNCPCQQTLTTQSCFCPQFQILKDSSQSWLHWFLTECINNALQFLRL